MRYFYPGALHIHTINSDGTGDIEQISKAAKKAGLSWIIITDHNDFSCEEGFYNGVCVIKGEEISPKGENHYLALGINEYIPSDTNPAVNVENVRKQGGFGFVAHPDESKSRKNSHSPINWVDKNVVGDGIEIWNAMSDWADFFNDNNIFSTAYSFLFRRFLIRGANPKTLKWWDDLNNVTEDIVPGVGGCDAHAFKFLKYFTVFSYEYMFKTVLNVIETNKELTGDFNFCKNQILNSLRTGKNIVVNARVCKENNFPVFYVKNEDKIAYPGDKINLDEKTFIATKFPQKSRIRLYCNGKLIKKFFSDAIEFKVEQPGKYRLEAFHGKIPFFYTNPVCITSSCS